MKKLVLFMAIGLVASATAYADLMPSFATVPTGWVTDRYQPAQFANVGTYQGRNDVLGIGISSDQNVSNRVGSYKYPFYNTQGMQYALSGTGTGIGSSISADLYIPQAWSDPTTNGSVRTDMWGVMGNGTSVTDYPIIGFTNYGGAARYRVWDENVGGGWVDLSTSVSYDVWTSFSIRFTGSAYQYSINGTPVYTDNTVNGSTKFNALIMQAYNFGDPSITGANPKDYTANWANTTVPEPSTLLILGMFGGAIGLFVRKARS